jgi:hypothetical protein
VIGVHAEFNLLQGFRVVDSKTIPWPMLYEPLKGMERGLTVVADFRYGYSIPLSCSTCDASETQTLRDLLEAIFMPYVGQRLSDKDLGLPPMKS